MSGGIELARRCGPRRSADGPLGVLSGLTITLPARSSTADPACRAIGDMKPGVSWFRDVRVIRVPLGVVEAVVRAYLREIGWTLVESHRGDASLNFSARNPRTRRDPLEAVGPTFVALDVCQSDDGVRIETAFRLEERLRGLLVGFSAAMLGCTSAAIVWPPQLGLLAPFCIGALAVVMAFWMSRASSYAEFVQRLYARLEDDTGKTAHVLRRESIPDKPLFLSTVAAMAALAIFGAWRSGWPSDGLLPLVLAIALVITIVVAGGTIALTSVNPTVGFLLENTSSHLLGAVGVGFYATVPLVFIVLADVGKPPGMGILYLAIVIAFLGFVLRLAAEVAVLVFRNISRGADVHYAHTEPGSAVVKALVGGLWLVVSGATWCGTYLSLSLWEYSLVGQNRMLPSRLGPVLDGIPGDVGVIVLLLWSLPMLAVPTEFVLRWARTIVETRRQLDKGTVPDRLTSRLREVCDVLGTTVPSVIVEESQLLDASVDHVIGVGRVLRVTTKALLVLDDDQLEALIAHEVWHLKKDSRVFTALNVLSSWTLFGRGFLLFTLDTAHREHRADAFAVEYLAARSPAAPRHTVESLLTTTAVQNTFLRFLAPSRSLASLLRNDLSVSLEDCSDGTKLRVLYEVFFGDLVASYLHPTLHQRIQALETGAE